MRVLTTYIDLQQQWEKNKDYKSRLRKRSSYKPQVSSWRYQPKNNKDQLHKDYRIH